MKRLSVVIANYNYADYVGQAIDSALALEWDDVEVVVVDDGSTDSSREVIGRYGDRVHVVLTPNRGQREAVNRGFSESTGDVVVFLDSDDVLPADLPAAVAQVWNDRVSKVQFRMQRIDASGAALGDPFPRFDTVPTPAEIRHWALTTTAYPTPPGSGNAYSRSFLDKVLPAGPEVGEAADSACLAAAPFLGDVVTVPEVIVGYRQHGANDSNLLADHSRFSREVARARARWEFAVERGGSARSSAPDALRRSRELLQFRVAASRVRTGATAGLPGDNRRRQFLDAVRSPFQPGPERLPQRVVIAGWCALGILAPEFAVEHLLQARWGNQA